MTDTEAQADPRGPEGQDAASQFSPNVPVDDAPKTIYLLENQERDEDDDHRIIWSTDADAEKIHEGYKQIGRYTRLNIPMLGERVRFIRQDRHNEGKTLQGEGVAIAVFLDEEKRAMVRLEGQAPLTDEDGQLRKDPKTGKVLSGKALFNVDLAAINPSDAFIAQYRELTEFVAANKAEGNKKISTLVNDYNARGNAAYDLLLGSPVRFVS